MATLFLRQHLKTLPPELFEAAQLDAAGPLRCLVQIALPLSWRAVTVVMLVTFVAGWNQYLWPLMVSVDDRHWTLVRALERVTLGSGAGALLAAMAMLPPMALMMLWTATYRNTE
jgi:sn-glycerol 3-phosphate transport system permease protein